MDSREVLPRQAAVLAPLIAVVLFLALYPQLALHRSEGSVKATVLPVAAEEHTIQGPTSVRVFGSAPNAPSDALASAATAPGAHP